MDLYSICIQRYTYLFIYIQKIHLRMYIETLFNSLPIIWTCCCCCCSCFCECFVAVASNVISLGFLCERFYFFFIYIFSVIVCSRVVFEEKKEKIKTSNETLLKIVINSVFNRFGSAVVFRSNERFSPHINCSSY